MKRLLIIALALTLALAPLAEAKTHRSTAAKSEFRHSHPCPSTGRGTGACPGYVIDHVKPLACGGADAPGNMQWQSIPEARAKDRIERRGCTR